MVCPDRINVFAFKRATGTEALGIRALQGLDPTPLSRLGSEIRAGQWDVINDCDTDRVISAVRKRRVLSTPRRIAYSMSKPLVAQDMIGRSLDGMIAQLSISHTAIEAAIERREVDWLWIRELMGVNHTALLDEKTLAELWWQNETLARAIDPAHMAWAHEPVQQPTCAYVETALTRMAAAASSRGFYSRRSHAIYVVADIPKLWWAALFSLLLGSEMAMRIHPCS